MVLFGLVRYGAVWFGLVWSRFGSIRLGIVRLDFVYFFIWFDWVGSVLVQFGLVWSCLVRSSRILFGLVLFSSTYCGLVWSRFDLVRFGLVGSVSAGFRIYGLEVRV